MESPRPQTKKRRVSEEPPPPFYKTRLCLNFIATGCCPYGDSCTYAHGRDYLRQDPRTKRGGFLCSPRSSGGSGFFGMGQPADRKDPQERRELGPPRLGMKKLLSSEMEMKKNSEGALQGTQSISVNDCPL